MATTNANAINYFSPAKFVVSKVVGEGTHTTLAGALSVASSLDTIIMMPGTYTENNTIGFSCNIVGFTGDSNGQVIINGTITVSGAFTVNLSNLELQSNGGAQYALIVSGSAATIVNCTNCNFNCSNQAGILLSSTVGKINVISCTGDINASGVYVYSVSGGGTLTFINSDFTNSVASTSANNCSNGIVNFIKSSFQNPLTFTGGSTGSGYHSTFDCSAINSIPISTGGGVGGNWVWCKFLGGTASAFTTAAATGPILEFCDLNSSNTNCIVQTGGTPPISLGLNTFTGSSSGISVSLVVTQLKSTIGSPVSGLVPVAEGGTGVGTLTGLLTGNGTSNITGTAITQYNVLTGGASNVPNSVAPSSTVGQPLISQGSSAQPIFSTLSATQVTGVATNTAPGAGYIGQQISSVVSGVSISSSTPTSVANISLTAGVWDVTVSAVGTNSGNVITAFLLGISTTNNTFAGTLGDQEAEYVATSGILADVSLCVPAFRVLLSGTTTHYMVAQLNFGAGSGTISGRISAVRVA